MNSVFYFLHTSFWEKDSEGTPKMGPLGRGAKRRKPSQSGGSCIGRTGFYCMANAVILYVKADDTGSSNGIFDSELNRAN